MTRTWDEFVASVFDRISPALLLLLLLVAAGVIGSLWYWFPKWVPRRWPRIRLPKWKKRPKRERKPKVKKRKESEPTVTGTPEPAFEPSVVLPDGMLLADRLAAEGRYAEAIRQRLRDVVGDLTVAGVINPLPGTTAAEVATDASRHQPALSEPLSGATELFSQVWYGDRPAQRGHDDHMRSLTGEVRTRIAGGGTR